MMIVTLLMLVAPAPPADATGLWKTPSGGVIAVERCGARLCGRIAALPVLPGNPQALDRKNKDAGKRTRPLKGLTMLWGLSGGPDAWHGGQVYNPEDGGTYSASVALDGPDVLKMKGCVAAFLCRTQRWTRVR